MTPTRRDFETELQRGSTVPRPEVLHEPARIGPDPRRDIGVREEPVGRAGEQPPEQGGLARPPGTRDDQRRDVAGAAA